MPGPSRRRSGYSIPVSAITVLRAPQRRALGREFRVPGDTPVAHGTKSPGVDQALFVPGGCDAAAARRQPVVACNRRAVAIDA
jgi:hypothetical protein